MSTVEETMIPVAIEFETIARLETTETTISLHTITTASASEKAIKNPTIVLLHFWGGSNRTFAHLIEELKDDYNIVAPSLRGWGKSSRSKDPGAYRMENYARDVYKLLVHLENTTPDFQKRGVVLVGHSMGAKIALAVLARIRFKPMVQGLVLVAPAPPGAMELPIEMRDVQVHAYDSGASAKRVIESVLLGTPTGEKEVEALAQDAMSGAVEAKAAWPSHGMGQDFELVVKETVRDWPLSTLRILVVVGALDRVETEVSVRDRTVELLQSAGAAVEVAVLEGVGHLIPVEAPTQLANKMRTFLEPTTPGLEWTGTS